MTPSQINNQTVIIAPLDWGLGHATRCIPIMKQLIAQGSKLIFAGNELQIDLINQDFDSVICETIPGYEVQLDSQSSTYRQILRQFKGMKRMAKQEHVFAQELVKKHEADVIISDNRYGFFAGDAINIFMTHQLNPQLPIFKKRVRRLLVSYINMFDYCWIPDDSTDPICGELLEHNLKIPVHFIGHLCRFNKDDSVVEYDYLAIVSGPEPERSRIQDVFVHVLESSGKSFKIITPNTVIGKHFVTNPSSNQLEKLINSSDTIISRGGYTTIMELLKLDKKALLIPTKGQYEQEYLAENIDHKTLRFIKEEELSQYV